MTALRSSSPSLSAIRPAGRVLASAALAIIAVGSDLDAQITVIRAGTVIDVVAGQAIGPRMIVVEGGRITAVRENLVPPAGATIIDLSNRVVLPGLFDVHTHLAAGYEMGVTNLRDYAVAVSTAERALQGVVNAWQMMASGFTTVRDLGNAGNYADAALASFFGSGDPARRSIYGGAILENVSYLGNPLVGPTIVYAGKIIAPFGAQFRLSPEHPDVARQDYLYADSRDQIRDAIRQNLHYGATWIKLVVDDQPYQYSADEIRFAVAEAARGGARVTTHCVTEAGARAAIEAGVASIEHGYEMSDETLALARQRGIVLVGTDPAGVWIQRSGRSKQDDQTIDRLRRAHRLGVTMAFGTDIVRAPSSWFSRGEIMMSVVDSWVEAGIPAADILRSMTTVGAELLGMSEVRGMIKPGYAADLIATDRNPLEDIAALKQVSFVMKEGRIVKQPGR